MLSGFLKKLLLSREATMMEGEITLLGHSFYMQPISELVFLHYDMKARFGSDGTLLIFESGKKSSQEFFQRIERFTTKRDDKVRLFLNMLNLYGFGEIQVVNMVDETKAVLEVSNNNFAKNYYRIHGKQENVDTLLSGLLAGFFEELWKKKVSVQEVACIANAKPRCQFRVDG